MYEIILSAEQWRTVWERVSEDKSNLLLSERIHNETCSGCNPDELITLKLSRSDFYLVTNTVNKFKEISSIFP